ncbi:hypothetical protein Cgig2_008648 [Carnegiea gigantea]|uniref:Thioredoxin domain-containing protein n=1 Tax=Carnegiea gigantea TaxID=171969 RepID=A0A9Q1JGZ5_9CARY|nr:hypothetical protein Cgig2_008648 [Carnegiea gigantea]
MATMLQSLAAPRASALRYAALSPISASSSSSTLYSLSTAVKLPEYRGLKARLGGYTRTRTVVKSPSSRSGIARVVCKSSETTVQCLVSERPFCVWVMFDSAIAVGTNAVPSVTEATWKSLVLDSDLPVVVEFWALWCGPCRMIQPAIDELPKLYAGRLKVFKVNTDESPKIASDYGVRSVPTVMIFKRGEKKETVIGAVPKPTLTATIEKFL